MMLKFKIIIRDLRLGINGFVHFIQDDIWNEKYVDNANRDPPQKIGSIGKNVRKVENNFVEKGRNSEINECNNHLMAIERFKGHNRINRFRYYYHYSQRDQKTCLLAFGICR